MSDRIRYLDALLVALGMAGKVRRGALFTRNLTDISKASEGE